MLLLLLICRLDPILRTTKIKFCLRCHGLGSNCVRINLTVCSNKCYTNNLHLWKMKKLQSSSVLQAHQWWWATIHLLCTIRVFKLYQVLQMVYQIKYSCTQVTSTSIWDPRPLQKIPKIFHLYWVLSVQVCMTHSVTD